MLSKKIWETSQKSACFQRSVFFLAKSVWRVGWIGAFFMKMNCFFFSSKHWSNHRKNRVPDWHASCWFVAWTVAESPEDFPNSLRWETKKTSLVPLIFFEAQATEEMWAYIADSMKFVTNSQISDTKVDWSVIYSNLIHLERCKRYTFWTLKNTWWFSVPEIEPHSVEGQKLPPIGRSHVDHWIMRFKSVLSLTNLKLFLLLLYPNLWKMYQLDNAYNTHKWGHRSINPKHFAANTNCSRNGHLECIVFFHSSRPPNLAWTLLWWDAACRALCSWKIEMDGQTQCKERSKKWRPSELTGCRRYSAIGHPRSGRSSETIKSEV